MSYHNLRFHLAISPLPPGVEASLSSSLALAAHRSPPWAPDLTILSPPGTHRPPRSTGMNSVFHQVRLPLGGTSVRSFNAYPAGAWMPRGNKVFVDYSSRPAVSFERWERTGVKDLIGINHLRPLISLPFLKQELLLCVFCLLNFHWAIPAAGWSPSQPVTLSPDNPPLSLSPPLPSFQPPVIIN